MVTQPGVGVLAAYELGVEHADWREIANIGSGAGDQARILDSSYL